MARQVEPWPNERTALRNVAATEQIPVLRTEDRQLYRGTRQIFAYLHEREPWRFAAAHRRRFADHRDARESDATGRIRLFPQAIGAAADSIRVDFDESPLDYGDGRPMNLFSRR